MKVALGVEYFGKNFHGWQIQKSVLRTVQSEVELALSQVANHQVRVFCSGRTDSGVHAVEQVIHFETNTNRTDRAWLFGGNVNLPKDVNFKWVKVVSDDFHARFSTVARSYKYKIHHNPVRSSLKADYFLWEPRPLNVDDMKEAAALLVGEHDFSCFRGSLCQAKSPIKTVEYLEIDSFEDELILNIKANAFLHHMVRNIVGTLLKIGRGEKDVEWMSFILASKDRKKAGPTAEPQGLYFMQAFYEEI
ncbi:tRNA pseudouridine(38-40) synthase TruA [Candidatus Thioglobus sp.]|nr:tRNA pseudouridine(38-40) synthase TruA [Candidatus Thioglobus sp.]